MQPIPLTEEIVLNCGFQKEDNKYKGYYKSYIFDGFRLTQENDHYDFLVMGSSIILFYFSYLHQLQNLYFALTGKELDVKF